MPYRRLPNTDQARVRALKAAVEKGEMYNVRDLAITLKTLFEARNFLHRFEAAPPRRGSTKVPWTIIPSATIISRVPAVNTR